MTAPLRPIATRFAGMVALSMVIWTVLRLAYAALADVPFAEALPPTSLSVSVVLLMCFLNALPRNTP